jgi:polygalacturonase
LIASACQTPPHSENAPPWETVEVPRLLALADSLTQNIKPWPIPDRVLRVEDFGALAGPKIVNTIAIQRAIDECAAKGGGVVLFSHGDYVTGTIELRSGVMIEVARGSRILGSTDLRDYPERIESFKSLMSKTYKYRRSLIYAENCDRVGIRGDGEIYFRGEREQFPGPESPEGIADRPFGIRMIRCQHVVVQGIFLHNAAAWMQSYLFCKDLIFDRMRVENQSNFNNDGLDLDGCSNVVVRDCYISSEDDAMCLKGASGETTENVLVERSTFVSSCNAFKIGTDTQGDFRNIIARDIKLGGIPAEAVALRGHRAISGITLTTVDGGNVENILITDVSVNQSNCPVFIRIGDRGRVMAESRQPAVGLLRKILIENVTGVDNGVQGSFISGMKGHPVQDVILKNYHLTAAGGGDAVMAGSMVDEDDKGYPDARFYRPEGLPAFGFYLRYARSIRFDQVTVIPFKADARAEALSGGDVEQVMFNGSEIR